MDLSFKNIPIKTRAWLRFLLATTIIFFVLGAGNCIFAKQKIDLIEAALIDITPKIKEEKRKRTVDLLTINSKQEDLKLLHKNMNLRRTFYLLALEGGKFFLLISSLSLLLLIRVERKSKSDYKS